MGGFSTGGGGFGAGCYDGLDDECTQIQGVFNGDVASGLESYFGGIGDQLGGIGSNDFNIDNFLIH
jgi:hypothetical protein